MNPDLVGTAAFDTGASVAILGGVLADDSGTRACVITSRPIDELPEVRLTVDDGERTVATEVLLEDWAPDRDTGGVDALCLTLQELPNAFAVGVPLRIWWGEQGPQRVVLSEGLLVDVFDGLARRSE